MTIRYHIGCLGENCPICPKLWLPGYEQVRFNLKADVLPPSHLQKTTSVPRKTIITGSVYETPTDRPPTQHRMDCKHNLGETGNTVVCPSCSGKVSLKVFRCEIYTSCTISKQVGILHCCAQCSEYVKKD